PCSCCRTHSARYRRLNTSRSNRGCIGSPARSAEWLLYSAFEQPRSRRATRGSALLAGEASMLRRLTKLRSGNLSCSAPHWPDRTYRTRAWIWSAPQYAYDRLVLLAHRPRPASSASPCSFQRAPPTVDATRTCDRKSLACRLSHS